MAIADVLTAIKDDLRVIPGLKALAEEPPEQLEHVGGFPALIVYAGPVAWRLGSADGGNGRPTAWAALTIRVELFVERDTLPRAVNRAMPFAHDIPAALFAGFVRDKFAGTVKTLGDARAPGTPPIRTEFGPDDWGTDLVRLRCEVDVGMEEEIFV